MPKQIEIDGASSNPINDAMRGSMQQAIAAGWVPAGAQVTPDADGKGWSYINPANLQQPQTAMQTRTGGSENVGGPGFGQDPSRWPLYGPKAPPPFSVSDFSSKIQSMYQKQLAAQKDAARGKADSSKAAVERQRAGLDPMFHQEKVEADTAAVMAGRRLSERLASMGLGGSGENISANARIETSRQGAFSNISQRRTQAHQALDQHKADLDMNLANDIQQLYSSVGAQQAQAMLQELMRQEQMKYQVHRDSVSDSQWQQQFGFQQQRAGAADSQWERQFGFNKEQAGIANNQWQQQFGFNKEQAGIANNQWQQSFQYQKGRDEAADNKWSAEFEWSRSANNPAVQGQLINNQIRQMEASQMPELHRLRVKQIEQDLAAGQISLDQARAQLNSIQNPTLDAPKTQDPLPLVKHYINQIERDFKIDNYVDIPERYEKAGIWPFQRQVKVSDAVTREQQRDADIKRYIENLAANGVPEAVLIELMRSLGLSGQIIK